MPLNAQNAPVVVPSACVERTSRVVSLSHAEPNSIWFHDPELSRRCSVGQGKDEPLHQGQNGAFVLPLGPQDNNPCVLRRGIGPDVAEIQIQGDQYAIVRARSTRDHCIVCSR